MRVFSVVAAAAACADGALLKKHVNNVPVMSQDEWEKSQGLVTEKKGLVQKSMTAWTNEKADQQAQLAKSGVKELMDHSSLEGEKIKFAKKYQEAKMQGHKKMLTMTHDEALEMLKSKIDPKQREQMSLLMKKSQTGAVREDDKEMYVRAMESLNDMYLSIDDERITTLTECSVELFEFYRKLWFAFDALRKLDTMIGEAYAAWYKHLNFWIDTWYDKYEASTAESQEHATQEMAMSAIDTELLEKESDVALYKFIMRKINDKCAGDASLLQLDGKKKAECAEKCAAGKNGKASMNNALLTLFGDKEVEEAAKKDLDEHAQMSLKKTLEHIHKAEHEQVHPKYRSFLQVDRKNSKGGPGRWMIVDNAACGCGTLEGVGCATVATLIGQELECAKQEVRLQKALKTKTEDDDKATNEQIQKGIKALEKAMEQWTELMMNSDNEIAQYRPSQWEEIDRIHTLWEASKDKQWSCFLRLFELESNYYCAIKHIRNYMRELTLKEFGADPEDVQDCEADDFMFPSGHCSYRDDPSDTHVPCIEGEVLPTNVDEFPVEEWARQVTQPMLVKKELNDTMGTVALACPRTISSMLKCNTFLCAVNCEMSDWSDWSTCSAKCDGGIQTQSREVIKRPFNGGQICGDTTSHQECGKEPCDKDCELHEMWEEMNGCVTACGEGRFELEKRKIAVEAEGKGECPDKHHPDRIREQACPDRVCEGDEQCNDVMDLVIAYECSNSVTRLGCWFMASFVVTLLQRMPTVAFKLPTMRISLLKFGNGEMLPAPDGTYFVRPPHKLSELSYENNDLVGLLYQDTMSLWGGGWHMGFNNIGSAMETASLILDGSDRGGEGKAITAMQKVLFLTKGKRAGCTVLKQVAETAKNKGVLVDLVLFNAMYAENPSEFEVLEEAVSYPSHAHFHSVGGIAKLNDYGFRNGVAQALIPKICPNAASPKHVIEKMCASGVELIHRGRTCHDWTGELCGDQGPLTLEDCRNAAMNMGHKGFIHTDVSGEEEATECNCLGKNKEKEKDENGQDKPGQADEPDAQSAGPQLNAEGNPLEETCTNKQRQEDGKELAGWTKQAIAAGNGDLTSHYMVITQAECQNVWSYPWKVWERSLKTALPEDVKGL